MARVVIIVDSNTGALIDVAGHRREDGRYMKFSGRMLSIDRNPILDYGNNGGDTLEISKKGSAGKAVIVKADVLDVTGDIKSKGKTVAEMVADRISDVTSVLRGKPGEIVISEELDEDTGQTYFEISLNDAVSSEIAALAEQLDVIRDKCVSKRALSEALEDIEIHDEDTLEDVKTQFSALLSRLRAISSEAENSEEAEGDVDE